MKQKFAIDKAKLKLDGMTRAVERDEDRAKENQDEKKSLQKEAGELGKEITDLANKEAAIKKRLTGLKKSVQDQDKIVQSKASKVAEALKVLGGFEVKGLLALKPQHGIKQEEYYFSQGQALPDFDAVAPAVTKVVSNVNFPRTSKAWKNFFWKDNFAVRWTGVVLIREAGDYSFSINSDDGSKLFIDGALVADADGNHEMQEERGTVTLTPGQHDIRVQYYEKDGDAGMVLKYQGADTKNHMVVVPPEALQAVRAVQAADAVVAVSGLTEEIFYFTQGPRISMVTKMIPDIIQSVQTVNVPATHDNWVGSIANEDFAVRYSGFLLVEKEGEYEFSLTSDDGSMLYIDNSVLVDNDGLHDMSEKTGRRKLSTGRHALMLDYSQSKGASGLILKYKGADSDDQMVVIPSIRLQASRGATKHSMHPVVLAQQAEPNDQGPIMSKLEADYKKGMHGTQYTNHPSVVDVKELVTNQYERAKAAGKIREDYQKKVRDSEDEIKEITATKGRLQKQKDEAVKDAGAAKQKALALEKKAGDAAAAAKTLKEESIDKPTVVYDKEMAAQKKEEASKAKAEKTLKMLQQLQQEQNRKVNAAAGQVENAKLNVKRCANDKKRTQELLEDQGEKITKLGAKLKEMKDALAKKENAMQDRIKAYRDSVRDLDKHKPENVRQHNLQPEE